MNKSLQNNNGFTLIELLIIISIVGVLMVIASMAMKDMYASYKIKGLARQVFSNLQYARLVAIKEGDETLIDWGKDGSGEIYYEPQFKATGDKLPKLDERIYLTGDRAIFKGINACHPTSPPADPVNVEFNPNGTAISDVLNGGIKLSKNGKVYRIYVSSEGTGNVRIINKATLASEGDNANECP